MATPVSTGSLDVVLTLYDAPRCPYCARTRIVLAEKAVPYETVTIHSNVPGSLYTWLADHGYAIDASVKPTVDDYEIEGFDFIALRLIPGVGVRQMTPVRVVTPGASPVLPLRMVAAGSGANVGLTLFVIGEGRWEAQNFPNDVVDPSSVSWDFAAESSNYGEVRDQARVLVVGVRGEIEHAAEHLELAQAMQDPPAVLLARRILTPRLGRERGARRRDREGEPGDGRGEQDQSRTASAQEHRSKVANRRDRSARA